MERFWSKVNKGSGNSCWIWTSSTRNGYGRFGVSHIPPVAGKMKLVSAHRFSWELENGPIENDLKVLHRCDNPKCVRPSHLFLGTQSENINDMVKKKRHFQLVKTHCPQGHPYSGENLRLSKRGHRICIICSRWFDSNNRQLKKRLNKE